LCPLYLLVSLIISGRSGFQVIWTAFVEQINVQIALVLEADDKGHKRRKSIKQGISEMQALAIMIVNCNNVATTIMLTTTQMQLIEIYCTT